MRKYLTFFRIRFKMGIQYRSAAFAGIFTQFFWGCMLILMYRAFYQADPNAFPMSLQATVSYVWLQQAFLALFMVYLMEEEIIDGIVTGNVAYELCRPIKIYSMWFSRSVANRLSKACLRCLPVLLFASLLPKPYNIVAPSSIPNFVLFLVSLLLGLLITVAFCMLIYGLTFFTVSPLGLRIVSISLVEFFQGGVIPIPFLPDKLRRVVEILPFSSMQNVPLLIYSGELSGFGMIKSILLQVMWLIVFIVIGYRLCAYAEKHMSLQGG